jgi:hypothetical protein
MAQKIFLLDQLAEVADWYVNAVRVQTLRAEGIGVPLVKNYRYLGR